MIGAAPERPGVHSEISEIRDTTVSKTMTLTVSRAILLRDRGFFLLGIAHSSQISCNLAISFVSLETRTVNHSILSSIMLLVRTTHCSVLVTFSSI
jgi:hypothetical protein